MDVRKLLTEYIPAAKYQKICEAEMAAIREAAIRSPRMDAMPRSSSVSGLETAVELLEAAERRLLNAIRKAEDLKQQIETMIDGLDSNDQKSVLRLRYIEGLYYYQIAEEMYLSFSTVRRLEKKAVRMLERRENELQELPVQ